MGDWLVGGWVCGSKGGWVVVRVGWSNWWVMGWLVKLFAIGWLAGWIVGCFLC